MCIHGNRAGQGVFSGVCLPIYQPGGGPKPHVTFPGICGRCVSCLQGHVAWQSMGKRGKRDVQVFVSIERGQKVEFFMSSNIYFASGVLSMLFQCSFEVVMSAVRVVSSLG